MIKEDLVKEVLEAIITGKIPEGWNSTTIVLIPKVVAPTNITQFRPISLCSVVYKVISKMVCACLNVILPDAINSTWSAFVPGRIITNNVLVAYECVHAIRHRKRRKPLCAVKLDMIKAYDWVEWHYLEAMMGLIMKCVR